jgi:hypothetical protein
MMRVPQCDNVEYRGMPVSVSLRPGEAAGSRDVAGAGPVVEVGPLVAAVGNRLEDIARVHDGFDEDQRVIWGAQCILPGGSTIAYDSFGDVATGEAPDEGRILHELGLQAEFFNMPAVATARNLAIHLKRLAQSVPCRLSEVTNLCPPRSDRSSAPRRRLY